MPDDARREQSASMSVIVARKAIDNAWQSEAWSAVSVDFDHIASTSFQVLRSTPQETLIRISSVTMTLHRKEMMGYRVNFANGEPRIYVALQLREFDRDRPIDVDLVTASGLEVQAYGHTSSSITDSVPMHGDVLAWVQEFMASQATEDDAFIKRQRDRAPEPEDYKFGKVALDDVRREAARRDQGQPTHPLLNDDARRKRH